MTITISPFVLGIIVTLLSEFLAFVILLIVYAIKHSRKTHENTSN